MNLEYLSLKGNQIKTIENIFKLKKMLFLDISENILEVVYVKELPKSLEYLNLSKNPIIVIIFIKHEFLSIFYIIIIINKQKKFSF